MGRRCSRGGGQQRLRERAAGAGGWGRVAPPSRTASSAVALCAVCAQLQATSSHHFRSPHHCPAPPAPLLPPAPSPCSQTFWEQIDDGVQGTATRKFFTVVPVLLFLLASHGTDFRRQPLGLNLLVVVVLTVAKMSGMHRVRIFGINRD